MKLPTALPHLQGRRGTAIGWAYRTLAVLTILLVAAGLWFNGLDLFRNLPADSAYGFRTYTDTNTSGNPVKIDPPSPEAQAAGLRAHDLVVAIDGQRFPARFSEFDVGAAASRAGESLTLTVRADEGAPERTVRLRRLGNGWTQIVPSVRLPVWLLSSSAFLVNQMVPVFLLIASLLLYRRRPRDPEAMLFAVAFLLMTYTSTNLWWLNLIIPLPIRMATFVPSSLGWFATFLAVAGFPDGRFVTRIARGVAIFLLVTVPLYLAGGLLSRLSTSGIDYQLSNLQFMASGLGAAVAVALRYRATPAGPERQQIKWAVLGFCTTGLIGLILVPPPVYDLLRNLGQPGFYFASSLLSLVIWIGPAAGLLVSQLRYRLYDADAAISRSVAYGVLTVVLLAVFAGSEKVIEALGERYFGDTMGALAGGLGAAAAAVLIVPLHHRFSHWAEKRFQKKLLDLRSGLPLLVGDLRETAPLDEIAEAVLKRVESGVRATRAVLLVGDEVLARRHIAADAFAEWRAGWIPAGHEGLDCRRTDPLLPMRVPLDADGCGRVGWLLLGPRPDGSFYGKDERETLAEIADSIARAVTIVGRRESREAQVDTRIGALEALVARLGARPQPQ